MLGGMIGIDVLEYNRVDSESISETMCEHPVALFDFQVYNSTNHVDCVPRCERNHNILHRCE